MARTFGLAVVLAAACAGCGGAVIEPGHRGLLFDPGQGGLSHEILAPGFHRVGGGRIDDFDVTYSTRNETLNAISSEGLSLELKTSIIFRPIVAELYQLDTEIGQRYYDEVVGPEFRAAVRGCIARHPFFDLIKLSEAIEDEVETEVRRRIVSKHIEIASVTLESIKLPPELVTAIRERQIALEKSLKQKTELESEALREKLEREQAWEREKTELEHNVDRRRLERAAESPR